MGKRNLGTTRLDDRIHKGRAINKVTAGGEKKKSFLSETRHSKNMTKEILLTLWSCRQRGREKRQSSPRTGNGKVKTPKEKSPAWVTRTGKKKKCA